MASSTRRSTRLSAASRATTNSPFTPVSNDGIFSPSVQETPPTSDEGEDGEDEDELAPLKGKQAAKSTPAKAPSKRTARTSTSRSAKRAAPDSSESEEDELPTVSSKSSRRTKPATKRRATESNVYVEIVLPKKRTAATANTADKARGQGARKDKAPTRGRAFARASRRISDGEDEDDDESPPSESDSGSSVSEFVASDDDDSAASDEEDRSQYGSDTPAPPRRATKKQTPSRGRQAQVYDSDDIDDAEESEAEEAMVQEAVRRSRADVGGSSAGPSTSRRTTDGLASRA
ncbi:uncharacterized protein SCHCODRAFT_02469221, partial [Schizophyllum commune H4-8]